MRALAPEEIRTFPKSIYETTITKSSSPLPKVSKGQLYPTALWRKAKSE